ncbi:sigma-70 family RNA polymerase sigma factor [Candidatus Gottesmanbacteria bacterium]|nr:sigma-70 family RNA polymerase sigma factor [Candidatus Gottesmanbacteria bacterium]
MNEKPDEALVREVQEGSITAYEILVKRYQQRLFAFVYRIVRDEPAAQEVVQDAFISLYKTIDRVDTRKKFSSYLYSIARNTAISSLRARKPAVSIDESAVSVDEVAMEERLASQEQREGVRRAIAKLEKKYRRVITLYYFGDLSYEEIGETLNLPINTVRTHLARAKQKLRDILYI